MLKISAAFDRSILLDESKTFAKRIEFIETNSEDYINEYFDNVTRDVDLRREGVKAKIDTYSDELIESLKKSREDCIKVSKETNQITAIIEKTKAKLNKIINQMETLNIDYEKTKILNGEYIALKDGFYKNLDEYKKLITGNIYLLKLYEYPAKDIFGELEVLSKYVMN